MARAKALLTSSYGCQAAAAAYEAKYVDNSESAGLAANCLARRKSGSSVLDSLPLATNALVMNPQRHDRPPFLSAAVAVVLLSLLAACDLAKVGATSQPEEHMPAFASIWLTAEPAVADRSLEVELRDQDDPAFRRLETFEPGVVVQTSFGVSAGPYRLIGQGGACGFDLVLGPELESDVVMSIDATGGCTFERTREHGPEVAHEPSGTLDVRVSADLEGQLLVEVRSLDTPANPVPDAVPPDEGRLAIIQPLWPGRYEVRLLRDGEPIETKDLRIISKPSGDLVEITLDGQPG